MNDGACRSQGDENSGGGALFATMRRMDMGRSAEEIKKDIESGNTALGIEFGSTRIKAVLTDGTTAPIAQGSYEWENRLENGIWTYSLEDIWKGLKDCYADLAADVKKQYGLTLKKVGAMGVSAMMPLAPSCTIWGQGMPQRGR